jgi:hypothetical protein
VPFGESIRAVQEILGVHRNWSPQKPLTVSARLVEDTPKHRAPRRTGSHTARRRVRGQPADRITHNPTSPSKREPREVGTSSRLQGKSHPTHIRGSERSSPRGSTGEPLRPGVADT